MSTTGLLEKLIKINEEPLPKMVRKQSSVYKLFPKFDQRVDGVEKAGGIHLYKEEPKLWHFKVNSATTPGLKYDILVYFSDLEKIIAKWAPNKTIWKDDDSGVDLRHLAGKILTDADLKIKHNCPSWLYHGFKYIATQRGDILTHDEEEGEFRPPKEKNPHEYGLGCKHMALLLDVLPFYGDDMAKHLGKFFAKEIAKAEKGAQKTARGLGKAAAALGKKAEAEHPTAPKKAVGTQKPPEEGPEQAKKPGEGPKPPAGRDVTKEGEKETKPGENDTEPGKDVTKEDEE